MDTLIQVMTRNAFCDPDDQGAQMAAISAAAQAGDTATVTKLGGYQALSRMGEAGLKAAVDAFVQKAQAQINKSYSSDPPTLEVEVLRRYLRVVSVSYNKQTGEPYARYAFCFIDLVGGAVKGAVVARGAVLKADGWKRPAKWPRGNVFASDNGVGGVSAYGAAYL